MSLCVWFLHFHFYIYSIFIECFLGSNDCYIVGLFLWEHTDTAPEQEWYYLWPIGPTYSSAKLCLAQREGIKKWNHSRPLEVFRSSKIQTEFYEERRHVSFSLTAKSTSNWLYLFALVFFSSFCLISLTDHTRAMGYMLLPVFIELHFHFQLKRQTNWTLHIFILKQNAFFLFLFGVLSLRGWVGLQSLKFVSKILLLLTQ